MSEKEKYDEYDPDLCCVRDCNKEANYTIHTNEIPGGIPFCDDHVEKWQRHHKVREVLFAEERENKLKKQMMGLWMIMAENAQHEPTIHRDYVMEKLTRIIQMGEMSFHPAIGDLLTDENLKKFQRGERIL